MNTYTKEILTILKNKYTQVVGNKPFQTESEMLEYYTEKLEDNLYMPMSVGAYASYGQGSGNEIGTGKMNALRSSSALTYNLFWDQVAQIKNENENFGKGVYQVEFEKQYHTLKKSASRNPANLDAFLYCKHTKEAIACEMKMTEWIFNKPGMLKSAYLNPENYVKNGHIFVDVAKELILNNDYEDPNTEKAEYPSITSRYDAFQMFKHAVACYNACVSEEKRKIEKLTLVNCAWTLENKESLSEKALERYLREEDAELEEFNLFKEKMKPIIKMINDEGIKFDIVFYKFSDFVKVFDKTKEELEYLKRY